MFPRNVPKRSLRMFPECSHEKFYERSIQMLSERPYGRFQERSLWIFSEYYCGTFYQYSFWTYLERSTGTFREHCFGTLKKPGHFLSSRNVPMEPSKHSTGTFIECSGKVLCYGGWLSSKFLPLPTLSEDHWSRIREDTFSTGLLVDNFKLLYRN